jgi:hypothetical protein
MSDPKDKDKDDEESGKKARDELFEAIDHLKNAAGILFDKASKDPTFDRATTEAEKVVTKIADSTEPIARQVTSELAKLTRKLSDAMRESAERSKKKKSGDEEE